ncbi:MAG: hypothetical protein WCY57_08940, partial [Micavibrio sp.]
EPRAKLHLAEEAVLQARYDTGAAQAKAARAGLPAGSPDWIRAGDILNYVEVTRVNHRKR